MNVRLFVGAVVAAAITVGSLAGSSVRAQEPSAGAVTAAKELVALKGGNNMFDNLVPGVIESVKNSLVPTNPNLMRELNEVALQLRKDYEPKRAEVLNEVAKTYARHFTEQELKDVIAFYKTPLGKKLIVEEPAALDESLKSAQTWANAFSEEVMTAFRTEMKKKGHIL